MRVLAAKFSDDRHARAARELLRRSLSTSERELVIAPLGTPGRHSNGDTVLCGRFLEEQTPIVARVVTAAGGEIVTNVDERLTAPRVFMSDPADKRDRGD